MGYTWKRGLHDQIHVSPRKYKLHEFLKFKKGELSPKNMAQI